MRTSLLVVTLLAAAALACGGTAAITPSAPTAPVGPLQLTADLTQLDVCAAIPRENIEAVLGRRLSGSPVQTTFDDNPNEAGCAYDAGQDAEGNASFAYVIFTPVEVYDSQPLYLDEAVPGLGEAAYFNNGADARHLWVKVNDSAAFVVAFGDLPREDGAIALARLILNAIE
jgi:hypothetical protein